ncbi:MAG TPA: aminoacyl-tRNA hydrolase [Chloroflexota bacterium]|nr:aminoacyl-tRNA hydrolase [Chloroflexota bacterium]
MVVGLGNPGTQYAATRHNVGFRCVDEVARRCRADWRAPEEWSCLLAVASTDERTLLLAKPQTYMNRSGHAVRALVDRSGIDRSHALVVYDEMDLPFGTLRLRERGSPGTHNGMRSVVAALQSEDVPRLRIGIGQAAPGEATDHVLSEFSPDQEAAVEELVARAADAVIAWATESAVVAMNRYNRS